MQRLVDRLLYGERGDPSATVRNHVTAVIAELGVRDRAEAVVKAREAASAAPDLAGLPGGW